MAFRCENCGADSPIEDAPIVKFFRAYRRELQFCGLVCALSWCALAMMADCRRGKWQGGEGW